MINQKELRVGNLVFSITLEITCPVQTIEVSSISLKCDMGKVRCDYVDHKYTSIDPIPLTSEWLERCGFEDGNNGYRATGAEIVYRKKVKDKFITLWQRYEFGKSVKWVFESWNECELEHVHQLQNLYWCLVGEELAIKET